MMGKAKEIVEDIIARRFLNPVYSTFFLMSMVLHWGFLYSLFALDQEYIWKKYRLLKNEYLFREYVCDWWFWTAFLLAGFLTYILIWHIPKYVLLPADKEDNKYRKDKEIERLNTEREIRESQRRVVVVEREIAEEKKKKATSEVAIVKAAKEVEKTDPSLVWEKEYNKFKNATRHYSDFRWIVESVYQHGGGINWFEPYETSPTRIPQNILAYSDVNDLVKISKEHISLTPKGKFFVGKYTSEIKT